MQMMMILIKGTAIGIKHIIINVIDSACMFENVG